MHLSAQQFWIVWSPQGSVPPTYKHKTQREAEIEAYRLANMHKGAEFYVLSAVACAVKPLDGVVVVSIQEDDEIPF